MFFFRSHFFCFLPHSHSRLASEFYELACENFFVLKLQELTGRKRMSKLFFFAPKRFLLGKELFVRNVFEVNPPTFFLKCFHAHWCMYIIVSHVRRNLIKTDMAKSSTNVKSVEPLLPSSNSNYAFEALLLFINNGNERLSEFITWFVRFFNPDSYFIFSRRYVVGGFVFNWLFLVFFSKKIENSKERFVRNEFSLNALSLSLHRDTIYADQTAAAKQ